MTAKKTLVLVWQRAEPTSQPTDLPGYPDPDATLSLLSMVLPTDWPLEPWLDWLEGRQR